MRLREIMQPIGGQPVPGGPVLSGYAFSLPGSDLVIVTTDKEMFEPECGCLVVVGMILGSEEPWLGFDGCPAHTEEVKRLYRRYEESLKPAGKARYDGMTALEVAVEMWHEETGGTHARP